MQSAAPTVAAYLAELPADRRAELETVLETVRAHVDPIFVEEMGYGMITWSVPRSVYPPGYHADPTRPLPFLSLAAQKQHLALYVMALYQDPALDAWFRDAWDQAVTAGRARRLDMGKSCVRFKRAADVPLDVIAEALRRVPAQAYVALYEAALAPTTRRPRRTVDLP